MIRKNRLGEERFHFQNVPAKFRERLIKELKSRPEFTKVCDATVGAGVTLSMTLPEPVEFICDGWRFHAFAWMGQIQVIGERESASGNCSLGEVDPPRV